MTDSDLLMLENLTYFDDNLLNVAGVTKSITQCDTLYEFLKQFNDEALQRLDFGNADSQEWAARIRYMQKNKDIYSLIVKEYNLDVNCLLFEDPDNPEHAIVAFKGTTGGDEWKDNAEGLNRTDTEDQLKAKVYIESLGYDSITVTGHSKGGNKAMYVAITCSTIDRCVSYDGQGFSKEFLDKYSTEVQNRASLIKNFSLSNDYVHILMFPIPGSEQIYMEPGNRVDKIGGAHYPIGPFRLYEKDGRWYIDETDGTVHITPYEDTSMTLLHEFTTFLMNNASEEELEVLADNLLGPLLKGIFGSGKDKWSTQQIIDHLLENSDELTEFVAYILKFIKINNLDIDDIIKIVESIGIPEEELWQILAGFIEQKTSVKVSPNTVKKLVTKLVEILFAQITDGKDDKIISFLVGLFGGDAGAEINSIWNSIEDKYNEIDVSNGSDNYVSIIRDYSKSVYDSIIYSIDSFERSSLPDVGFWNGYSGESWFSKILTAIAMRCINGYRNKLTEINVECKRRVNTTFENIENVDKAYSKKIDISVSSVKALAYQMQS